MIITGKNFWYWIQRLIVNSTATLTKRGGFKMKNQKLTTLFGSIFLILFLSSFTIAYAESKHEPMELKVTSHNPAAIYPSKLHAEWGRMVEERSEGTVKLVFYFSGSLAGYKEAYRATLEGVADMCFWVPGIIPGIHALNEITSLPLVGWQDMFLVTRIYHDIWKKFPEFDEEFKGLKNLYTAAMPPHQFHFTKKVVRVPDDVRGMKILGPPNCGDLIKAAGAVPIHKGPMDYYMSLQKGLADGIIQHWPIIGMFKLEELLASHTQAGGAGFGLNMAGYWMNMNTWNKLPPIARRAFMDLKPWVEQQEMTLNLKAIKGCLANAEKMGHSTINPTPEEIELWTKAMEPVREKWIVDMEAKGKPAKAIYTEVKRLISLYNE